MSEKTTTHKIEALQSEIDSLAGEIDVYGDKTDNASNPTSSTVMNRMIDRRDGLLKQKKKLVKIRITEVEREIEDLQQLKTALVAELKTLV